MQQEQTRLAISRAAAQLFWDQGVAATTGEQIAAHAGVSVRTVWRHFRTKESCAEPIVDHSWSWFLAAWQRWPLDISLADHIAHERAQRRPTPQEAADDKASAQMIVLSHTEPAIRTAFLMSCDELEQALAPVVARRLGLAPDHLDVLVHTSAITAVVRVISEQTIVAVITHGKRPPENKTYARITRAVHDATGGAIGGPVGA